MTDNISLSCHLEAELCEPLSPDVRMNLEYQLRRHNDTIQNQYASFKACLIRCVKREGVAVEDLRSFVLELPALANNTQPVLLHEIKEKLHLATTINEIFDLIGEKCASFFHYEVFESLKKEYCTTYLDKKLNYKEHFDDYAELLKISEFFDINPKLKEKYDNSESTKNTFKVGNISVSNKISSVINLRDAIASNLNMLPATLKLVGIEEGCVVVTFLIPTMVAEIVFAHANILNSKQVETFKSLSIFWLKCGNFMQTFLPELDHQEGMLMSTYVVLTQMRCSVGCSCTECVLLHFWA